MSNEPTLALRPDVVVTVLDDGAVLLDLENKFFYSVNTSGWAVVEMLENGAAWPTIREKCGEWGVSADSQDAVRQFLQEVQDFGLLEAVDGKDTPVSSWDGTWCDPRIERHREPLQRVMVSAFDPSLPLAE